ADAAQGLVVEEDHRPVHGGQAARRLAQAPVEAGGRLGAVEREEQVGERLEGVDVDDPLLARLTGLIHGIHSDTARARRSAIGVDNPPGWVVLAARPSTPTERSAFL